MKKAVLLLTFTAFLMASIPFAMAQQQEQAPLKSASATDIVKKKQTPVLDKPGDGDEDAAQALWFKIQQEALNDRHLWEPAP